MTDNAATLADLVRRCAGGDDLALGELYDQLGRAAYTFARRIVRDDALAEDVVQEAFLDAWRGASLFDPARGRATTWLLTFVHRRAVDTVRRRAARPPLLPADAGELPEPATGRDLAGVVADADEAAVVRRSLASLPDPHRQVLELAYLHGYSQSEIAQLTGQPLGTVKSRTHTALARLRELLGAGRLVTREEQEALVTGYALGALTPGENDAAELLLAASPDLRGVYEDALETALLLAIATADEEPPEGLRDRIVDAARKLRE